MMSLQVFVVLSVLTYSVSAITNLEVKTALDSFEKTLKDQIDAVNQKLAAQKVDLASTNTKLDILQEMIMQNIIMTCDADSCPNKTPVPAPAPAPAPGPVLAPPLAPVPAPAGPGPVLKGCDSTDTTSTSLMNWNPACPVTEANRANPSCFLAKHNVKDTENCLKSLVQESAKGVQGCITKKVGVCSCTLDTVKTPDAQATVGHLKDFSSNYAAIWAIWSSYVIESSDGSMEWTKGFMKYDCRG